MLASLIPIGVPDETGFGTLHAVRFQGSAQTWSIGSFLIDRMRSLLASPVSADWRAGCERNRHAPRRAISGQCTEVVHWQFLNERGAKLVFLPLGASDETKLSAPHAVRSQGSAQRRSISSSSINRMRRLLASLTFQGSAQRRSIGSCSINGMRSMLVSLTSSRSVRRMGQN